MIAFIAGLSAASIWLVSSRVAQDEIVIRTKPSSFAQSGNSEVNTDGKVGQAKDHILVRFKGDVASAKRQEILNKHGLKEKSEIKQIGVKLVTLPTGQTPDQVVKKMLDTDRAAVEFVEVDAQMAPGYMPNDPQVGSEWHISKIGAPAAWDSGKGAGITIAILDTGTDCTHQDLQANCVPGWNVVSNNSDTAPIHPHGTYTAGTAAAVGDNALQMAGVSYASKIMPVRITNDSTGFAYWSDIANGVIWAADHGAKVVNNSYGAWVSSTVQSAAAYLNSKGGLMFSSAMNEGTLRTDPNPSSIMVISATTSSDVLASWSTYGPGVDLSAPGDSVACTLPGGGTGSCYGTSFASPVTAAVAALMWSAKPSLSPAQVESIIKSTAVDLGAAGRDDLYGDGRVNAAAAMTLVGSTATDNFPPTTPSNLTATASSTAVALSWGASTDNVGVANYLVYRNDTQIGTTTKTTYTDTTISPEATYTYTVKAIDTANNFSGASNTATVTVPVPSLALTSITAKATSATTATVSWTTNIPASGSFLEYGTSATNLVGSQSSNQITTNYSADIIGLMKKTRYYYRVTVTSMNGEKIVSNIQNFTTRPK